MLTQRIPKKKGAYALSSPLRPLARSAILSFIILITGLLAGCGSSSKSANNTVAQVLVTPTSASLVAGQVLNLSFSAVNSSNTNVATSFTFSSSNTMVATVSPRGEVCGGVWDSLFQVCNGTDAVGNPVSGMAVITVTAAQGVSSAPVNLSVHPSVTAVSVDPLPAGTCFSSGNTHQFAAHAFHNGTEITNQVGNFSWSSSDNIVANVDTNGLATARTGGLSGIVASIGSTTSPATSFKTCMPAKLVLQIPGDDASNAANSVTLNMSDTKTFVVGMLDEKGAVTVPAPVTLLSNNPVVASVSGNTVTANSPGGAGLVAVCAPPSCGNGLNTPIYSNLFSITVNGSSPNTTTVYAGSAFLPPPGSSISLMPIDISKSPPAVGTAIPLPGLPNSIVFDRTGARAFLGTDVGLAVLDAATNVATLAAPAALGKVLAVSPDGNKVIVSNAATNPATGNPIEATAANQRVWVFDRAASTLTTFFAPGATAATYDDDGFRAYIVTNDGSGKLYVFSPLQTFLTIPGALPGNSTDAATLASGPFAYVANSSGLKAIATCNNTIQSPDPPVNSSPIQLVSAVKNANTIFAVGSTGINVEKVTVTQLTPPVAIDSTSCAPGVSYSNLFVDFGVGPLTARQLLVGSDGVHSALLAAGTPKIFTILNGNSPGIAQLAGSATEPVSATMLPDGHGIWVGVAGSNSVDFVDLRNNIDEIQVPMNFKKVDGTPAPPNLVAIRPK